MRALLWIGVAIAVVAGVAIVLQHDRYLDTRRNVVFDEQDVWHASRVFHVVTLVELGPDQELLTAVAELVRANEAAGGEVVYAGKVVGSGLVSEQVPNANWNAFVLTQFSSREVYDEVAKAPDFQAAREQFAASYVMGLDRSPALNLGIPILLLAMRAADVVLGTPARYPFEPAEQPEMPGLEADRRQAMVEGLLAEREYGADAVVILNFIKNGSQEQQDANSGYGRAMLGLMAEMGNGPMHMGQAVTLEGDADFDNVAIVYYPGVEYFAEMLESEYFNAIIGDKQLGDTLSKPSVPLLPHL